MPFGVSTTEASLKRDLPARPVQISAAALHPKLPELPGRRALVKPAKTRSAEQAIQQRAARPGKTHRVGAAHRAGA